MKPSRGSKGRDHARERQTPESSQQREPSEAAAGHKSDENLARRRHYPTKPRRPRKPGVDVDAVLARLRSGEVDVLAETEAQIAEDEAHALGREPGEAPAPGMLDLTDVRTVRALLRRHGLRPKKGFGQHLLVDREALDAIVAAADLTSEDSALEVGAGTGVLTIELARRARRVVAVEIDTAILPLLHEMTGHLDNVEIIPRDLLDVDPAREFGDAPYKLVANLPYYITALTLRHFLESANPPRLLVIMVQKEVAERITAKPGDMSLLALSVQFYGEPRIVRVVPASSFFPPPEVDSAIVRVDLRPEPPLAGDARALFFGLAHAGFAERRKMLHNSLARSLGTPQETVARWLEAAQIDPARRAETLSLDDWVRLTRVVLEDEARDEVAGRGD